LRRGKGVFFLGAANATAVAREDEKLAHGVLTTAIIDGLKSGLADVDNDGRVTGPDLFSWCRDFANKHGSHRPIQVNRVEDDDLVIAFSPRRLTSATIAEVREKLRVLWEHQLLPPDDLNSLRKYFLDRTSVPIPPPDSLPANFLAYVERKIGWDGFWLSRTDTRAVQSKEGAADATISSLSQTSPSPNEWASSKLEGQVLDEGSPKHDSKQLTSIKKPAILWSAIALATIANLMVFASSGKMYFSIHSSLQAMSMSALLHVFMSVVGTAVAMRLAFQAYFRNLPTPLKYTTSPQQYLGSGIFVVFASALFLLLVYRHKEIVAVAMVFGERPSKDIIDAVEADAAPYLLVVAAFGLIYLYCLTKEANWNVLLMMRDAIQAWTGIPQLAQHTVEQIKFSMRVPVDSMREVLRNSPEVVEQDFYKDRNTADRIWAEICYINWWVRQAEGTGDDAIIFTEPTLGFQELLRQFDRVATRIRAWKAGMTPIDPLAAEQLVGEIKELRNGFSWLVACYLIYRNSSPEALRAQAKAFGIELEPPGSQNPLNPLRYWIVYLIALMASVYLGVYASGITYDLMTGAGLNFAQDPPLAQSWVFYSLSNYGVAIIAILLLRVVSPYLGGGPQQSHLVIYCLTFLIAFLTGPFGLAIAVHLFGPAKYQMMPLVEVFSQMHMWGWGPALVCVYISYYLDRQIWDDLPDIKHSYSTVGWRLLNCIGFAALTMFL
jgi:hypothetical protein